MKRSYSQNQADLDPHRQMAMATCAPAEPWVAAACGALSAAAGLNKKYWRTLQRSAAATSTDSAGTSARSS